MSDWKNMTPSQKERHRVRSRAWRKMKWRTDPQWRAKRQALLRSGNARRRKQDPLKRLFTRAMARARIRGLEFSIEISDLSMPLECPVLGIKITPGVARHDGSPSLDRVDNSKGYIKGNVRVISFRANFLKGSATIDEVRRILAYMEDRP